MTYKVTDSVYCDNLMPGKTYTINGKLMDKATGKAFLDADGKEIVGTTTFTATVKDSKTKDYVGKVMRQQQSFLFLYKKNRGATKDTP